MTLDLTFKDVCAAIKKQGKEDPKLIDAVDQLLGLALICSPVILGPAAIALLPTLAVKNEITKIGKSVFEKLTKKKDDDYLVRQETMQMAYGLLVFTSFFDALDGRISKALRDEIALLNPDTALAYIQMLRGIGAIRFLERYADRNTAPEFCERMFHPRLLLELSERNPEAALAYIQMLRELGGGRFVGRRFEKEMGPQLFSRNLGRLHFTHVFDRKPAAMAVWLTVARIANSNVITESVDRVIVECFRHRGGPKIGMALLPISALPDLHWLATKTKNLELASALSELTGSAQDENLPSNNSLRTSSQ